MQDTVYVAAIVDGIVQNILAFNTREAAEEFRSLAGWDEVIDVTLLAFPWTSVELGDEHHDDQFWRDGVTLDEWKPPEPEPGPVDDTIARLLDAEQALAILFGEVE